MCTSNSWNPNNLFEICGHNAFSNFFGGDKVDIQTFTIALAAFAFGFSLCNVIYVFFSPHSKRNDCSNKTPRTDKKRKDRNNL